MFQHLSDPQDKSRDKSIYIMQNGNPDCILKTNFTRPITKAEITDLV